MADATGTTDASQAWPPVEPFDPAKHVVVPDLKTRSRLMFMGYLAHSDRDSVVWERRSRYILIAMAGVLASFGILVAAMLPPQHPNDPRAFPFPIREVIIWGMPACFGAILLVRQRSANSGLVRVTIDFVQRSLNRTSHSGEEERIGLDRTREMTVKWASADVVGVENRPALGQKIAGDLASWFVPMLTSTNTRYARVTLLLPRAGGGDEELLVHHVRPTEEQATVAAFTAFAAHVAERLGASGVNRIREDIAAVASTPSSV